MGRSILSPSYWLLKLRAVLFRSLVYCFRGTERYLQSRPLPDGIIREGLRVPSRDKGRFIGVDLYRPADKATGKLPVVVNSHGSGYVIPSWGEDFHFVTQGVKALGCIVLDCNYRKAPEYPYPSAHDDADDVVGWVLSQPDRFDVSKVALSGFSAGAGLALSSGNFYSADKIKALSVCYPPVDVDPTAVHPDPPRKFRSGIHLSPGAVGLFNKCYLPDLADMKLPRFNIRGLETFRFPNHILVAAGDADLLHDAAKIYFDELAQTEKTKKISFLTVEEEEHAFDKNPTSPESIKVRDDTHKQMFGNIKSAWSS